MSRLPKVKGGKKIMHIASCFGAAIVILGALFKIMHYPGASIMLPVGLIVETGLFIAFGLDIPHEEVDWTLAYPELAGMGHEEKIHEEEEENLPITQQLDNLLADAKIGPELIESLGTGIRALTDTTGKISDISNATIATNEYVDSVKNASKNVTQLSDTYSRAADAMANLADSNDAGSSIGDSLTKVSKNLSALNATYELQLQGSQSHLEATTKFYDGLADLMKNLHDSVDDTKKYRQEMATLSTNLTALNTVYGNMLSAMNVRPS
ncbi:gliding motility protein GldL [Sphingobacteriaceae bacterium]|nr:gliding motility protein GldL [Sphingobacteriaceae bacterium]